MTERISVSRPHFYGRETEYVAEALASTLISGGGPFVDRMEALVAGAAGTRYAVAVANGTVAVDLALKALEVVSGDEVIVPDFSMFSPIGAVLRSGARPVPVDADRTWNIDPARVEAAITPRTRGIAMVHTYGHPADGTALRRIADRHDLWLLEDAAEAMGATLDGRPVGSFGTLATFSFYSNKVVTCGEGGAVVTDHPALNDRLRHLRNLGFGSNWDTRFVHDTVGFNFRLSNVLAAIGCAQLENLTRAVKAKQDVAARYASRLAACDGVALQPVDPRATHTYWVVGVLVPEDIDRLQVAKTLDRHGIETRPFFHPVHRQPCLAAPISGDFPVSDDLAARGLYLPSFVGMPDEMIDRVAGAFCDAVSS
jgi:perosamine synthetase